MCTVCGILIKSSVPFIRQSAEEVDRLYVDSVAVQDT